MKPKGELTPMQAIQTKFLGPTDKKWQRVKAICQAKSRIYEWNDEANFEQNCREAAQRLAKELGWNYGKWYGGGLPDGSMVWVCEAKYNGESFEV